MTVLNFLFSIARAEIFLDIMRYNSRIISRYDGIIKNQISKSDDANDITKDTTTIAYPSESIPYRPHINFINFSLIKFNPLTFLQCIIMNYNPKNITVQS